MVLKVKRGVLSGLELRRKNGNVNFFPLFSLVVGASDP
jgi:hypothetical protein